MTRRETEEQLQPYRLLWIALVLLVPASLLAFGASYFNGMTFSGLSTTILVDVHAGLMMLWILMLIGQAWFVRTGRLRLHRWVGRSSYVIAPLTMIMTVVAVHELLNRKTEITTLDARLEIYDLFQVVGFLLSWALGLIYRRNTPVHVRFMVSTVFAIGNAIVFRILMNWFHWVPGLDADADAANIDNLAVVNCALLVLTLSGLIVMDWQRGIRRSPFWLVTVTTLLIHIGFFTFARSDWWMALVVWFASLPL